MDRATSIVVLLGTAVLLGYVVAGGVFLAVIGLLSTMAGWTEAGR